MKNASAGHRFSNRAGAPRKKARNFLAVNICFFNRSYWPDQAATGQLLTELAEDLVSRYGSEVTVVAGRALNAARADTSWRLRPVTREMHEGVEIHRANGTRLRPRRFAGRATNYLSYFSAAVLASF